MARVEGEAEFVVAVDAGGTHTRVGCFSPSGGLLAKATGRGGSPSHNDDARENVADTISAALARGGLRADNAVALGAGLAAVSRSGSNQGSGDNSWVVDFIAVPGLECPRAIVNDAVIAHRGALSGSAGVIVVAGTGSMILAITEQDEEIESGQFQHYAGGARHLVFDVIERLLTTQPFPTDDPVAAAVLDHWHVADVQALRRCLLDWADRDRNDRKRHYGAFAPVVTELVDTSVICDAAIRALTLKTAQGIRLLAPQVERTPTPVALAGALATAPAFRDRLDQELRDTQPSVQLIEAALDPLGGAAIIAYECAKITVDAELLGRLAGNAETATRPA